MQGAKNNSSNITTSNLIQVKQSKPPKPKKKLGKNDINYQGINSLRSLDHDMGYHKKSLSAFPDQNEKPVRRLASQDHLYQSPSKVGFDQTQQYHLPSIQKDQPLDIGSDPYFVNSGAKGKRSPALPKIS